LEIISQGDPFVEFYDFMAGFNDQTIEFRGRELKAKPVENRLPKALVWCYGVDNLMVLEEVVEGKEIAAGKAEEGVENPSIQGF
jgi:hypothetical protein